MSPYQQIAKIDRQIDAIRAELFARGERTTRLTDALFWQAAWDRHPDLRDRDKELLRERGQAQLERDLHEERQLSRPIREKPLKK